LHGGVVFVPLEAAFFKVPKGARVVEVAKPSVAQSAGFLAGDVITAVNGEALTENVSLEEVLEKSKPGDEVKFEVYRNDAKLNLSAKLGELK
jgi:S1-C subfamily serine protease